MVSWLAVMCFVSIRYVSLPYNVAVVQLMHDAYSRMPSWSQESDDLHLPGKSKRTESNLHLWIELVFMVTSIFSHESSCPSGVRVVESCDGYSYSMELTVIWHIWILYNYAALLSKLNCTTGHVVLMRLCFILLLLECRAVRENSYAFSFPSAGCWWIASVDVTCLIFWVGFCWRLIIPIPRGLVVVHLKN